MKFDCSKLLFCVIASLFFVSCKESTETPPFVFNCDIQLINKDGSSPFSENKDKIKLIAIKVQQPLEAEVASVSYVDHSDYLSIQISEWNVANRNKGHSEQEYIVQIQYPKEIRKETDTLRIKYQFKDYRPSVIEAFYNDEKPQSMKTEATSFKIEN